ncbi:hypothetical protein D3C76_1716670 [compost metagenome]
MEERRAKRQEEQKLDNAEISEQTEKTEEVVNTEIVEETNEPLNEESLDETKTEDKPKNTSADDSIV